MHAEIGPLWRLCQYASHPISENHPHQDAVKGILSSLFGSREPDIDASAFDRLSGKSAPNLNSLINGDWTSSPAGGGQSAKLTMPYAHSVWVQRAIKTVADPIKSATLILTEDARGGEKIISDPRLRAFWESPAMGRTGPISREDVIEITVGWLKLAGEVFWIMDDTWLVRGATKTPIIIARPEDMRPVVDSEGNLSGWFWQNGGGRRTLLIPEQVMHLKYWSPYDDIRGLPEWEAAAIAAKTDYAQGVFARNIAFNNGDTGPFVIAKAGQPTDPQIRQITEQLRQKRELARRGEMRAVFLSADVEIKEPGIQAVDAAYVAQRLENRHEIYIAFGVPPSFADVVQSYSVGSASDRYKLIEETCIPLACKLSSAYERVSQMFLGRSPVFAEFDFSGHSTMVQVRAERMDSASKAIDRGMPWTVASDYFRLKLPRFTGDDIGRVPFNLQEIGAVPAPPPSAASAKSMQDACGQIADLFIRRAVSRRNAEAESMWSRLAKLRKPWEAKCKSKVTKNLMDARRETLSLLAASGMKSMSSKDYSPTDVVFDLASFVASLTRDLSQVAMATLEAAGIECWSHELGRDDPFLMPASDTVQAVASRANLIKDASTEIHSDILSAVRAGIEAGETMQEISDRVKAAFNGIDATRAATIATTETGYAYETGRSMAMRRAGVKWKQWVTSMDGRERATHAACNGKAVEFDQPFEVGGYLMMHPCDPAGGPEEVINCRCICIPLLGPPTHDITGNEPDPDIPY